MRARLNNTFQSLQVRNYRLFALGQLVKLIGVWMMFTTQDWLVFLLGGTAAQLGIVTALQFTPVLALTLLSGRLADRYDKRKILFVANTAWTILSVLFSILVVSGSAELWHVYVFALLLGVASAVETPVRQSFVSELVEIRLLPNALGLSAATFNSARVIGPSLAGIAIALFDVGPVFVFSAVLAVAPLICLLRMRPAELYRTELAPAAAREPARVVDGLRYVRRRPDLMLPMVLMSVLAFFLFNFPVTLQALAKTGFNTGAASFGLFTTAVGLGALVGALVGGTRRARPSVYTVIISAMVFSAFGILVGILPVYWLVVAALVPTGFFMVFFAQAANQRVQLGTDAAYRGRVMALWVFVFMGLNPISGPLVGWLADHAGAGTAIWLGGSIALAATTLSLVVQLRHSGSRLRMRLRPVPRVQIVPAVAAERA
ncbi:MFS transporter [Asanoa ishikariensis]|uniref:Predicted arabinose efflux permease, MFS family n=1 Tax=Asanoa ishikariensis TaxID=137265 RepID=A0A1H3LHQ4_9ACTN|nr:MFS transporter [Asanoa ishikariensis]GIF65495.1 MFS transporter [Asanoa ishikariensis]SDY64002.1 Predicted arabinose efflux permease, MFS family [Asanoa ishikariensis]